ncbi:MAG: glutathione S-transferase family protein, partial [Mesorhizobium sp.]
MGSELTLADLHAAPIIGYFIRVAEGRNLLAEFADVQAWWVRIAERPSFARTEKAG